MMSSVVLRNRQNLLGQKVCVESKKHGGIELYKAVGENDGIVDNRYFTFEENYGIFVPASETKVMNTSVSENLGILSCLESVSSVDNEPCNINLNVENNFLSKISILGNSQPEASEILLHTNALNKSYTISKECDKDKKLSVISEEDSGFRNLDTINFKAVTNVTNLSDCNTHTFFTDQNSGAISSSFINIKENELNHDFEENYDSDESLGILPELLEDFTCDSLIFDRDDTPDKHIDNFRENENFEIEKNGELTISPICNKLNVSLHVKYDESPVCDLNIPKCASTPKHEINFSYIVEDLALTQNISSFHFDKKNSLSYSEKEKNLEFILNKTNVIDGGLNSMVINMLTSAHLKSAENADPEQNALNVTCEIIKSLSSGETSLNKTFRSHAVLDKCILPTIVSHAETSSVNKPDIPNQSGQILNPELPYIQSGQSETTEFDADMYKENCLNITCNLVGGSNINSSQAELKNSTFSGNPNASATNFLNTTLSYPLELGKTQQIYFMTEENISNQQNTINDKPGDVLNTTYEKIDESCNVGSETLKCITNLKESNKPVLPEIKSKIKKTEVFSLSATGKAVQKDEFGNKGAAFDRKSGIRKSVGCFQRTGNTGAAVKKQIERSVSNNNCSSEVHETKIISHSSTEDLIPKCFVGDRRNKNSLIKKEMLSYANIGDSKKKTVKILPLKSKLSENKHEETISASKFNLKSNQESRLNETINLTLPVPDFSKTVVKKPRQSVGFPFSRKSSFAPNEIPLDISTKTINPVFQKKASVGIPKAREEKVAQKSKKEGNNVLFKETGLKEPVAMLCQQAPSIKISSTEEKIDQNSRKHERISLPSKIGFKNPVTVPCKKASTIKIFTSGEEKIAQNSKNDETICLPSKSSLKKPAAFEEEGKKSRLPGLLQKNIYSGIALSKIKSPSNVARSTYAVEPSGAKITSKFSIPRKSIIRKNELDNDAPISLLKNNQASKEQSSESLKHLPSSRISSIPKLPRQQEKSSQAANRRTECSIRKSSGYNLR